MPDDLFDTAPLAFHEYRSLRDAIAHRGQLRVTLFLVGMTAWAALAFAMLVWGAVPAYGLVPVAVLVATFEAVHQLHVSAERIGRYVRVFFEDGTPAAPRWETVIGRFGAPLGGSRTDPLFVTVFAMAVTINLLGVLLPAPTPAETLVLGALHAVIVVRMVSASRSARRQRADDEARFRKIKEELDAAIGGRQSAVD